VIAYLLSTATT